jgi:hypothetical protein
MWYYSINTTTIYINMKKAIILSLSALAVSVSQAAYMVKVNLGEEVTFFQWAAEQPVLGPWVDTGPVYDCSDWTPDPSTITVNMNFTQTATDCKQNQEQTAQDREIDTVSGTVRDSGDPYVNTQYITVGNTRAAVGLLESWVAALPEFTSWVNNGALTGCSNWSPATSTVTINQDFTQTATDCTQAQTRSKQDREQETTTGSFRNVGAVVTESQNLVTSSTRLAKGAKETWVAIASTSTAWVNNGALTGCSNWSPEPSTVNANQAFTQTATDCKQPQTSTRQDREQETTTLAIRNKGIAVTETQNLITSSTRSAIGTKSSTICRFNEVTDNVTNYGSIASYSFTWDGEWFYMGDGGPVLNYNGYRYTISSFVKTVYSTYLQTHYYTICRTPL